MAKNQICSRNGLLSDVNVMMIRERVNDVKMLIDKQKKFILFIDLKNTYGYAEKLFMKMKEKGLPEYIIN